MRPGSGRRAEAVTNPERHRFTRRGFLELAGGLVLGGLALASYAFGIEPGLRLVTTPYRFTPPNWTPGLSLRAVVLADVHACEPWMSVARIERIVERANALKPDIAFLLGDYSVGMARFKTADVPSSEWAPALGGLNAPLGTFAVLGNHDWWEDRAAQRRGHGPTFGHRALEAAGVRVLENDTVRLLKDGHAFNVAGLGDQIALLPRREFGRSRWRGVDDLPKLTGELARGEPTILLAHEPDVFPSVPDGFALTLSGHTHGGQVRLFGHSPVVPSRHGDRYAYGHVVEGGRHLVVSGGLGCSIAPVRFGVPPEIVVLDLGAEVSEAKA